MKDEIERYLSERRGDLVRFATLQLRNRDQAEEAVQQATLAALENADRFAGRASVRTWIFSILKNKIIDRLRHGQRESTFSELAGPEEDGADLAEYFTERGFWRPGAKPARWVEPDDDLEQEQFWRVFELCLEVLPERTARVFMMREVLGFETNEICKELSISTSNCWVILHRARGALRGCLEERWFAA